MVKNKKFLKYLLASASVAALASAPAALANGPYSAVNIAPDSTETNLPLTPNSKDGTTAGSFDTADGATSNVRGGEIIEEELTSNITKFILNTQNITVTGNGVVSFTNISTESDAAGPFIIDNVANATPTYGATLNYTNSLNPAAPGEGQALNFFDIGLASTMYGSNINIDGSYNITQNQGAAAITGSANVADDRPITALINLTGQSWDEQYIGKLDASGNPADGGVTLTAAQITTGAQKITGRGAVFATGDFQATGTIFSTEKGSITIGDGTGTNTSIFDNSTFVVSDAGTVNFGNTTNTVRTALNLTYKLTDTTPVAAEGEDAPDTKYAITTFTEGNNLALENGNEPVNVAVDFTGFRIDDIKFTTVDGIEGNVFAIDGTLLDDTAGKAYDTYGANISVDQFNAGREMENLILALNPNNTNGIYVKDNTEQSTAAIVAAAPESIKSLVDKLLGNSGKDGNPTRVNNFLRNLPVGKQEFTFALANPLAKRSARAAVSLSSELSSAISNVVSGRVARISAPAAGDDNSVYGAWIEPFYQKSRQKVDSADELDAGYKARTYGATIGFDAEVAQGTALGLGASITKTDVDHKDTDEGSKTKSNNYYFFLYGTHDFGNSFFAEGDLMYGYVNLKDSKIIDLGNDNGIIENKYKTKVYSAKVLGGYSFSPMENMSITPTFGLAYSYFKRGDIVIREDNQEQTPLMTQGNKSYYKLELIAGLRSSWDIEMENNMVMSPELRMQVRHNTNDKSLETFIAEIDPNAPTGEIGSSKTARTMFDIGTGVTFTQGAIEYGVNYDGSFGSRYQSHKGSLKVRVNF